MYNIGKQSIEQKRKKEKMNMVLNNLEQKLGGNEELCKDVARIIDMTIENNEFVTRLEEIETNIPEIKQRITTLIKSCIKSCSNVRTGVMKSIHDMLSKSCEQSKTIDYILKIQRTIDYCISNYLTYKESDYNAKYCACENLGKNSTDLSINDILKL